MRISILERVASRMARLDEMPSRVTREETRQGTGYCVRRTITDVQRLILDHPLVSPQPSPDSVKITRQSIKRALIGGKKKAL